MKKNKQESISDFFTKGIWMPYTSDEPLWKKKVKAILRAILLLAKGFNEHQCQIRASALTFFTMLSIVPVLAMLFGIAKGFGLEKSLRAELANQLEGHEEIFEQAMEFSLSMIEATKGGVVAGIGLLTLLFTIMRMLNNIELSFNAIWELKKARSIVRKFTDYLTLLIITPIFIVVSGSLTVFINTKLKSIAQEVDLIEHMGPLLYYTFELIPYFIIWLLFTLIYIVMPNTKVKFKSALLGGVVAGTIYQFVQWGYIEFQVGVSSSNAIYGSFAALPLFLVWLQASWIIVLIGAELAFIHQNMKRLVIRRRAVAPSWHALRQLVIYAYLKGVNAFEQQKQPLRKRDLAQSLQLSEQMTDTVIQFLQKAELVVLSPIEGKKGTYLLPTISPRNLSVGEVLSRLENTVHGQNDATALPIPVMEDKWAAKIEEGYSALHQQTLSASVASFIADSET